MRRIVCLCLCFVLLLGWNIATADSLPVLIEQGLATATDEELAEASALIKNEQRARMKTKIQLEPAECSIDRGKAEKITAAVIDLPEGVQAGELTWTSADPAIAEFQKNAIKGISAGTTTVTCTCVLSDGTEVSADCVVTVVVPVQSVRAKEGRVTIMASESFTPVFEFKPEDATSKKVVITSSDESILKPDGEGNLIAIAAGKANVTATTTDGSNKTAKIAVEVTRKIGKYDGAITFQGLEWGSNVDTCFARLKEDGLIKEDTYSHISKSKYVHFWPNDDLKFTAYEAWNYLPVALDDAGGGSSYLELEKSIAGYKVKNIQLSFLNRLKEDGSIDTENQELIGVHLSLNPSDFDQKITDIFKDLLTKYESQYGEFTIYSSSGLRSWTFNGVKYAVELQALLKNAKQFKTWSPFPDEREDVRTSGGVLCVLHGADDTGIAIWLSGSLEIFYGKTDAWKKIEALVQSAAGSEVTLEEVGV